MTKVSQFIIILTSTTELKRQQNKEEEQKVSPDFPSFLAGFAVNIPTGYHPKWKTGKVRRGNKEFWEYIMNPVIP
jgi:hypothetical protein